MLYERGAEVDFGYAAGLGDVEKMKSYLRDDGTFTEDAYTRHRPQPIPQPTREGLLLDAMIFACVNGREEAVRFLLEQGADVNRSMKFGPWEVTPLHAVAWAGWPDLVPVLVEAGADLNVRDPEHQSSPPGWAAYCKQAEALERFLEYSDRFDLRNATEFGCVERFRELFGERHPDEPIEGGPPGVLLRAASAMGHVELVQFLLERGADPKLAGPQGFTALKFAEARGHADVVKLLRDALS
jgi:ankyrin repeat protein